jgi:Concanavalin A-like lectin/glucanases superfamily
MPPAVLRGPRRRIGVRRRGAYIRPIGDTYIEQVSGLVAWWDATRITNLTDGAAVSQWNDSSGNENHATQATGTAQPTYKTAIQNGLSIVRFDGTTDYLTADLLHLNSQTYSAAGATIFAVVNLTTITATANILSTRVGSLATNQRFKVGNRNVPPNDWNIAGRRLDADAQQVLTGSATTAGWKVHAYVIDWANSNADIYIDGTNVGSTTAWFVDGTTSPTNSMGTVIGAHPGAASEFWVGDMGEIAVYNRSLLTADRQTIEYALANKWGLLSAAAPKIPPSSVTQYMGRW